MDEHKYAELVNLLQEAWEDAEFNEKYTPTLYSDSSEILFAAKSIAEKRMEKAN